MLGHLTRLLISCFACASNLESFGELDIRLLQQLSTKGWRVDFLYQLVSQLVAQVVKIAMLCLLSETSDELSDVSPGFGDIW